MVTRATSAKIMLVIPGGRPRPRVTITALFCSPSGTSLIQFHTRRHLALSFFLLCSVVRGGRGGLPGGDGVQRPADQARRPGASFNALKLLLKITLKVASQLSQGF